MPTAFLDNKSSHFFIFNPWIRLQLNCPCATFFFACSNSLIFILSRDPFHADLPVLCPPENTGEPLVFGVSRGRGMEHWSYLGRSLMISFGWWCYQFMPAGDTGEHVVIRCFRGIWNGNVDQTWVTIIFITVWSFLMF